MKLLHLADLHLDRPFEGLRYSQTIDVLPVIEKLYQRILDVVKQEHVDIVCIVGDTFHTAYPDPILIQSFCHWLQHMVDAGAQIYLMYGNHDYYTEDKAYWPYPKEGVTVWQSETVSTVYGRTKHDETYAITSFSYTTSHISRTVIQDFPTKNQGIQYHIGMYHGQQHGDYAPFSVVQMNQLHYDYMALGHYHLPTHLAKHICYAGTPQPKRRHEAQAGKALLVEWQQEIQVIKTIDIAIYTYDTWKVKDNGLWQQDIQVRLRHITQPSIITIEMPIPVDEADIFTLVSDSVSGTDTPVIIDNISYTQESYHPSIYVDDKLIAELKRHYQEDDIFEHMMPDIGDRYKEDIRQYKVSIIEQSMKAFLEDIYNE